MKLRRALLVAIVMVACLGLGAGIAGADVSIRPDTVQAGDVADLKFRVTNDRVDAYTKTVQVVFPGSPSFETVQAMAPAGWSSSVDQLTGTVSSVTFEFGKIEGTQEAEFTITVAAPIYADRVVFKVLQTYSDGQVVRWTHDPAAPAGTNDSRKSPVLKVEGAVTTTSAVPVPTGTTTPKDSNAETSASKSVFTTGNLLILLGILLLFGLAARRRQMSRNRQ